MNDDILRAAWMMAVGASDAYFSDAYADLIARALQAKDLENAVQIPDRLNNLKLPVMAVLRQKRGGWRWRMAARELIEDENVLSISKIRALFNHFFRKGHKILSQETVEAWITHRDSKVRLFGLTATAYRGMNAAQRGVARKRAVDKFDDRLGAIFQRRHDCIHNCDRPKIALQLVTAPRVEKVIDDVEFLVKHCDDAFRSEFPIYLRTLGFSAAIRARVCA